MSRAAILAAMLVVAACGGPPGTVEQDAPAADAPLDAPGLDALVDAPGPDALLVDAHIDGGDPFAALQAMPGRCSAAGWCWQTPSPHGNDYIHVRASAPDNVWLTARQGTVMQWNGTDWRYHTPLVMSGQAAIAQFPMSMSTGGPSNTWLIFANTLQQWDGENWNLRDALPGTGNPNFNNVWVAPDGAAWATTSNGTVQRWQGATLQEFQPCADCFLGNIWGTSPTDIFITTLPAGILHYDGVAWSSIYQGPQILGGYLGVAGDVWVSGGSGGMMHWDGAAWSPVALPAGGAGRGILPIAYLAHDDVWWWREDAGFLHWNGTEVEFRDVDALQDDGLPPFNSALVVDGRWWMVGAGGAIYTRFGDSITGVIRPHRTAALAMWGTAADDMYYAIGAGIRHVTATGTTVMPVSVRHLSGIHTGGVDELFGVSSRRTADLATWVTTAWHSDGAAWTETAIETAPLATRREFLAVFAMAPGEAMAVGQRGLAAHFTEGAWRPIATGTTQDLNGVWGPDPDHLWIAGHQGTLLRWERDSPAVMTADASIVTTRPLGPVHGADGVTWIASPETSTVWRNDGSGWVERPASTTGNVEGGLFAISATEVVMSSGAQTLVSRSTGGAFQREDTPSAYASPRLFRPPGGPMFASGSNGVIVHP